MHLILEIDENNSFSEEQLLLLAGRKTHSADFAS